MNHPLDASRLAAWTTAPRAASSVLHGAMRGSLCALLWLCSVVQAQGQTATVVTDAFRDATAWATSAEGRAARFVDGRATLPALADDNAAELALSRSLDLPPGSAWQASLRITTAADAGENAAAGLAFMGPNQTQVSVMLRPREGDVVVIYREGSTDRWQKPLMGFTRNTAVRGHGQANLLGVSSRDGRLFVSVNDQLVGATRSLDFAPSAIGLRNSRTAATYEALQVQTQGMDSRLGRLLGLVKTPGARVLFADAPSGAPSAVTGLFSSAASLFKGLTGSGAPEGREAAQPPSPSQAWGESAKDGAYRRDSGRGVVVLANSDEDTTRWAGPDMLTALPGAPVFVQATITLLSEPEEEDGPGVYAEGAVVNSDGETRDQVLAKVNDGTLELKVRNGVSKEWDVLDDVELPERSAKAPMQLRLVLSGRQALVFLDGRWITSATLPRALALERAGVRVEGKTTAEFSGFTAGEL
jgi:hypothetical protein